MTFDEYVDGRLGALLRHAAAITCDPHLAQDGVQEVGPPSSPSNRG